MLVITSQALSQSVGSEVEAKQGGKRLLVKHCAKCHAIGRTDESRHPSAPDFRDISKKYPVEFLAESLAEGIMTGHPDMPVFHFEADDVEKLIIYLESIQNR